MFDLELNATGGPAQTVKRNSSEEHYGKNLHHLMFPIVLIQQVLWML